MNKLFLPVCLSFCLLFSCQSEDIDSGNGQSGGKQSSAVAPNETSSLSQSIFYDPHYVEPNDPGTGGTGGGDVTFVMPSSPTMSNGVPFIAVGKAGTIFTSTGQLVSDLIALGPAEESAPSPGIILTNAARLWMGFNVTAANTRYIVRGYPIAIYNGSAVFWNYPVTVQVVVASTVNSGIKWVPTTFKPGGGISTLAHFDCVICSPEPGVMQGTVTMTQCSINAAGQLTVKAKLEVPQMGKVFQINKVNYQRYGDY